MRSDQIKAPTFDNQYDLGFLIGEFMTWIISFNWFSLYDNKRVKFAEMTFIGVVQFYWESIEDCLERRGKPPIID
jgi:hypothetical protein